MKQCVLEDIHTVGFASLGLPVVDLGYCGGGFVVVTKGGVWFSENLKHWAQGLSCSGLQPPQLFCVDGVAFCFAHNMCAFSFDGRLWRPLVFTQTCGSNFFVRGIIHENGMWYIWGTYMKDNPDYGWEDDPIYDSYSLPAILFSGRTPGLLQSVHDFGEDCARESIVGLDMTDGHFLALSVSEPPQAGYLTVLASLDGRVWSRRLVIPAGKIGVSIKDYKMFAETNRVRLIAYGHSFFVRGSSLLELDPDGEKFTDTHPDKLPNSFAYLKVFPGKVFYSGEELWCSQDLRHLQRLGGRGCNGMSFVLHQNVLTAVEFDGSIWQANLLD